MDTIYPFFCGIVISALVYFFAFPQDLLPVKTEPEPAIVAEPPVQDEPAVIPISLPIPALWDITGEKDHIPQFYQHGGSREEVLTFFSQLLRSPDLAFAILDNAETYDISPSLAVALCWTESRFNIKAVNRKNLNGTIDRGLFQLNSATFPKLTEAELFDPQINAKYGLSHLRWCIDSGGSTIAGLAMYNAGTNRVHAGGVPKKTLDYIADVLNMREQIERLFAGYAENLQNIRELAIAAEVAVDTAPLPDPIIEEEPEELPKQRLALLRPISGRLYRAPPGR
ncbi:MAG: lytic transglycosylase domain-containing protein [Treponema sp.]|nr:lytic transglycosylase domain-containing protein [Treponema sp.]